MDQAQQAVDKLFSVGQKATTDDDAARAAVVEEKDNPALNSSELDGKTVTKEAEVNPAVEHETIKREHETKEDTLIDKERHQHHYHTTVQPLKDGEVLPTQHNEEVAPVQVQEFDHDDAKNIPEKVDARNAEFQSKTVQGEQNEMTTQSETVAGEQVHHHLHETIQPVIEKETVQPSVTHKTIPIKEIHHDGSKDHGTTTKPAISVDEFQGRLDGEAPKKETLQNGAP